MRFLSLFSGIEAASVAWLPLGWECVAVAEIEKFPSAVLAHHYPEVPNLGDITGITKGQIEALGQIDLVVGGFPCQDLSIAGKRKGLRDEDGNYTRSGLFFDAMRIVRWANPRYLLLENVPGIYSSNRGRDFASVVGEVLGVEFAVPTDGWRNTGVAASDRGLFEWATLDAQWFGVPQRRRRMFALADFGDWRSRPPVLFELHSLSGNPAPSREKGENVAPTLDARAGRSGETSFATSGGLQAVPSVAKTVPCLDASFGRLQGCSGQDANHGHGHLIVFHGSQDPDISHDVTHPLGRNQGQEVCIAFAQNQRDEVRMMHVAGALAAEPGMKQQTYVATPINTQMATRGPETSNTSREGIGIGEPGDPSFTLQAAHSHAIQTGMQVRRLTPRECERLQGFPDYYTLIDVRGKPAADGPRYKALGNSMAVPVMAWIGMRIQMVEEIRRVA